MNITSVLGEAKKPSTGTTSTSNSEPTILRARSTSSGVGSSTGRHLSVLGLRKRGVDRGRLPRPCRIPTGTRSSTSSDSSSSGNANDENIATTAQLSEPSTSDMEGVAAAIFGRDLLHEHRRRALLVAMGLGLSVVTTYFLYLVATPVLGLMGVATMFFGGAIAFDNVIGAIWTEISDLIGKLKAGSLGLLDDDDIDDNEDLDERVVSGDAKDGQENSTSARYT